jgi:5,10-methenyltetrahydromethanopterin hydrogenase
VIIDGKGRIAGKVSVIDTALAVIVIGLAVGFAVRQFQVKPTVMENNVPIYVTVNIEPIRDFSMEAINEGDLFYEQYATQSMGKVVKMSSQSAKELIKIPDGTIHYVEMEQKYRLTVTLECRGIIRDTGYYINGNSQIAEGGDLTLQSNKVLCYAKVATISETL